MIDTIYTFGTSFTAGGGFEWEGNDTHRKSFLNRFYGEISISNNISKKQKDWAWPSHLQRFINENSNPNLKVLNLAKNGYGNEKIYRNIFEIVTNPKFSKENSLFLIEFSHLNRKEIFLKSLNDYIICNYWFEKGTDGVTEFYDTNIAHSWYYDTDEIKDLINRKTPIIKSFLRETIDESNLLNEMNKNITLILSFLQNLNVNYLTTSSPVIDPELIKFTNWGDDKRIIYRKENFVTEWLEDFIKEGKLDISTETNGRYDDFHAGFQGNREIAKQIFNNLVQKKFITGKELKADWNFVSSKIDSYRFIL